MKNFYKNLSLPIILIIVLVALLLLQRSCLSPKPGPSPESTVTIDTMIKWDTVRIDKIVYVPKWKIKVVPEYDTIFKDIDTLTILRDYYTKYFYQDTVKVETYGSIFIDDTVTQNSIFSRKIKSNLVIPTITITNTKETLINKRELYLGVGVSGNTTQLNYLGGELLYKNKKYQVYGIGLGINQELKLVLSGRMYWKLK